MQRGSLCTHAYFPPTSVEGPCGGAVMMTYVSYSEHSEALLMGFSC